MSHEFNPIIQFGKICCSCREIRDNKIHCNEDGTLIIKVFDSNKGRRINIKHIKK